MNGTMKTFDHPYLQVGSAKNTSVSTGWFRTEYIRQQVGSAENTSVSTGWFRKEYIRVNGVDTKDPNTKDPKFK